MSTPIPFPPIIELDTRASTLLDVLVDLGHLDETSLEQVNNVLSAIDKPLKPTAFMTSCVCPAGSRHSRHSQLQLAGAHLSYLSLNWAMPTGVGIYQYFRGHAWRAFKSS